MLSDEQWRSWRHRLRRAAPRARRLRKPCGDARWRLYSGDGHPRQRYDASIAWRAVATRYEKAASSFLGVLCWPSHSWFKPWRSPGVLIQGKRYRKRAGFKEFGPLGPQQIFKPAAPCDHLALDSSDALG
jgi:hypothetical protein